MDKDKEIESKIDKTKKVIKSARKSASYSGLIAWLLVAILAIGKAGYAWNITWPWVFAPIWFPFALIFGVLTLIGCGVIVGLLVAFIYSMFSR